MKKVTVLLTLLVCMFLFSNTAMAQTNQPTSDTTVDATATAKKRPAPVKREYPVEDYLPILGKQMRAQGMRPPKPFFVSAIYYHMEIPQNITNAKGWGPDLGPFNSEATAMGVRMENAKVITNSYGLRAGVNILPFWSVFGVYIHTDVTSKFTAVADGNEVMTDGFMLSQALKVKADTGAIGTAFSYGMRLGRVVPFAVINGNYAWSFADRVDKPIETLIVGARIGLNVPLPKDMVIAAMFGGQYTWMPMGNEVSGRYSVTLPAGTMNGQVDEMTITTNYKADAEYASPWTLNAGIMFQPIRYFNIVAEVGFLQRLTAMVTAQVNF